MAEKNNSELTPEDAIDLLIAEQASDTREIVLHVIKRRLGDATHWPVSDELEIVTKKAFDLVGQMHLSIDSCGEAVRQELIAELIAELAEIRNS